MTSDDDRRRTATGSLDLSSLMGDGSGADDADERTIAVGALDEADERTLLVTDSGLAGDALAGDAQAGDETIVLDAEETIVADRGWGPPRAGIADAGGDGSAPIALAPAALIPGQGVDPDAPAPRRSRRAAAQLARVELPSGLVEAPSAEGAGVGARDAYVPRPVPTPPIVPTLPSGGEATRAVAPSMPSVARSARRAGRLALILAAAAVVVTIGGLILIVVAFLAP